ncbi:hypothetical protein [Bacillus sp. AFS014408]|uniref:hypothetical protein n=1 Tax=Bacillus sp. AFS014408 TaxID=2034278 RepID=UPI000BF5F3D1|nr:hypothetical protein [Bacillus sp. AFS014408]PEU20311.1 hypothetical protein CN525_04310 [Bacillus sp. AFS014408]
MSDQLSIDDILGHSDYAATSTADKFLAKKPAIPTYAVDFFDKDQKQKLRWFEAKTDSEAEGMARKKYGRNIIINDTYVSDKSLKEIMAMD